MGILTAVRSRVAGAAVLGACVCVAIALADVVAGPRLSLVPLLVAGPLVAATDGSSRRVLPVVGLSLVLALVLGASNHFFLQSRHVVGLVSNLAGGLLAWQLARAREQRERRLAEAQPHLRRNERVQASLRVGRMGTWWWERSTGAIGWDREVERLFRIDRARFAGTAEAWLGLIDPRDRDMVAAILRNGARDGRPFRFDHRCVWPDGSVHWIDQVGDAVFAEDGTVSGLSGLAFDVDERHRQLDDRTRLLSVEHAARLRAEYLARVHEVLATSVDAAEILERATDAAVPELADWCIAVLSVDRPRHRPAIVVAHTEPAMREFAAAVLREQPYAPDADFGAAKVIRTGEREVLSDLARLPRRGPGEVLAAADVDAIVTVPLVGPLGTLGALQLIRGRHRGGFTEADIELIEDVAGRCGAAVNTAVLFSRQASTRAALDTLQQVSGRLARAATRLEVAEAILAHGKSGLRSAGAAVYVDEGRGAELVLADSLDDTVLAAAHALADGDGPGTGGRDHAVTEHQVGDHTVLVTPLLFRGRRTGSLLFAFDEPHALTVDETSMLVTLASRCAGALERAALYERERDTALVLQRRLLPDLTTGADWLEVAACYRPATGGQIGGDWFQIVDVGPGQVVAVVGDAVGHGMPSAAAMGQLRASIATAVSAHDDPAVALELVDRFAAQGADTLGASVALVALTEAGGLRCAVAGHPPVLSWGPGGPVCRMVGAHRPLLGLGATAGRPSPSAIVPFGSGDALLLYTDGLVERRGESIDVGIDRLSELVERCRDLSPQRLCDTLVDELVGPGGADDVAVLVLRRR